MSIDKNKLFFNEAFSSHFKRVVTYLFCYCKDMETAKNIAQDSFITFWENIDKVDKTHSPLPYLYFISRNKMLNYLQRENVNSKYTGYIQKRNIELYYRAISSVTMENVEVEEVKKCISKSLSQMNSNTAETFMLSRFKGMKNAEIAEHSKISIKTVEYRLMSALRILRNNLKEFIILIIFAKLL